MEKGLIEKRSLLENHLSPLTLKDPSVCLFNYNLIIFYCMVHPLHGENPLVENRGIQGPSYTYWYFSLRVRCQIQIQSLKQLRTIQGPKGGIIYAIERCPSSDSI